jgi:TatD DNase family protein
MMIDIGCNLTHDSFDDDRDQVIADALAVGVETMVITGSDARCSQKARDLAHQYPACCYATAGIHPHHASECNGETLDVIQQLLADDKVLAVGETGLDYFRDFSPREAQLFSFEQHIALAVEHQLPMFLHQRDAHKDFGPVLREHRDQLSEVVVHCFTDGREALFDYLDLGCYIGITGWICDERRGQHLLELVRHIPQDRFLIETDAPYLLPRTIRPKPKSRRNEPKYLPHVAAFIASHLQLDLAELQASTTANSKKFFNI